MLKKTDTLEAVGDVIFAARRIVLADRVIAGTVTVSGGRIAAIEEDRFDAGAIDCGDDVLIPGQTPGSWWGSFRLGRPCSPGRPASSVPSNCTGPRGPARGCR